MNGFDMGAREREEGKLVPVVSDLDNCIVAGDELVLKTDYELLARLSKQALPWDYSHFVQAHGGKTFEQILNDTRRALRLTYDERSLREFVAEELDRVILAIERGDLEEVPEASRVIREIVRAERDFAVVSSSHRRRVEASLRAVGLSDIVAPTQITSAQSDYTPPRPKPDPSCYIDTILARMSQDPSGAWAIEDSMTGLSAAAAARDFLRQRLVEHGYDFTIIWFTGLVDPTHYPIWKQRALELRVPYEVRSWGEIPHLFELVESGKKAEAAGRYGLKG